MSRPAIEVADIFRAEPSRWFRISFQQLKVVRALTRCRTAALGGHIDRCTGCGKEWGLSYNSCLMGSLSLWGVREPSSRRLVCVFIDSALAEVPPRSP